MSIRNTCLVALGLIATSNIARAGTATCDGNWSFTGYWPSAAYAVINTQLRYHLTAANWALVGAGSDDHVQAQYGPVSFEGNWGYQYLEGVFTVRWDITIFSGLDHVPTPEEQANWPASQTHRFGFTGAMFTCTAPPPPNMPYIFSAPGFHTFFVPEGCDSIDVKLWGAGGGGYPDYYQYAWGGGGGFTSATIDVSPGDYFEIGVGQGGTHYQWHNTGGGATTVISPMNFVVYAQAGGGGAGGQYQGGGGGAGGGDIARGGGGGGVGDGGGANNLEGRGGRNWDETFNDGYTLFNYLSSTSAGEGYWLGGLGLTAGFNWPTHPGGGGSGWTHGPGVTTNGPGQGTFTGSSNIPAGISDPDFDGQAGYGAQSDGNGSHGRAVIRCR